MSLLRPPPAAATRRGAGLELPKSPLPSSAKLPPPPPRPSSMVRFELKFCSTTSAEYFSTPLWSVHLRVCSWPSMYTFAPFFKYCSAIRQSPSLKITTRCHSVFSLRSPVFLSRQLSEVATLRLAIGRPSWVRRISGSRPRLPTRMTLFTEPAMTLSRFVLADSRDPNLVRRRRTTSSFELSTAWRSDPGAAAGRVFLLCSYHRLRPERKRAAGLRAKQAWRTTQIGNPPARALRSRGGRFARWR